MKGLAMRLSNLLVGACFVLPLGLLVGSGISQALEAGDAAHGEKVFAKCKACHSLEAGVNKVGPSLNGVIGREAAKSESFKYSDAMKNAHVSWTPEALDQYLANPRKMIPGTKMAFPGLPKPKDRADVIFYLQQAAGAPQ
jgi:cytochrome c